MVSLVDLYREAGDAQATRRRPAALRLLSNAAHLYRLRVREQPLQELLAVLGIAAGVALLFAVQVASTSITGSLEELAKGVTGDATLEIASRGPAGMDQSIVTRAERLTAVHGAAPVLQQRITLTGPGGSASLTLVGVDGRLSRIGGPLVRRFEAKRAATGLPGLFVTDFVAKRIRVASGSPATVVAGEKVKTTIVSGTLSRTEIGNLSESPVVIAPLGLAQRLSGSAGRIDRVLIRPTNSADAYAQLRRITDDRYDVRRSDAEVGLLTQALKPDQQSSALFSALAVIIGLLFAFNAMLLGMARRRRQIAYLRMIGSDGLTVIAVLAFEAVVLGVTASVIGVTLGDLLSRAAFQTVPEYLASGFTIGGQRLVEAKIIVLSLAGGIAAAMLASVLPAIDLFRVDPVTALFGRPSATKLAAGLRLTSVMAGVAATVVASGLAVLWPQATPIWILGGFIGLGIAFVPLLMAAVRLIHRTAKSRGGPSLAVAAAELTANSARTTAVALIATGAMASILAIGGARLDLERGVDRLTREYFATSDLWISPADKSNVFVTRKFDGAALVRRLSAEPRLARVSVSGWTFLDFVGRRVLVISPPTSNPSMLVPSQVIRGDLELASKRLKGGKWVAISTNIASALKVSVGDGVTVPTPSGLRTFRVAAVTANHGWPSGSLVISGDDYRQYWGSRAASALGVALAPGTTVDEGKRIVNRALAGSRALVVQTPDEMVSDRSHAFVQGLARLRQISALVLGASVLAIIAAMFASVWQRRGRIAWIRAMGMHRLEVFRSLYAEVLIVMALGGAGGMAIGIYGQYFGGRWTAMTTGYRVQFGPAVEFGAVTLLEVIGLAMLATLGPAILASRVRPRSSELDV